MNTYPPLPRALTPASSSTPGPPPFGIIQTPFWEGRSGDYSVHSQTLALMNRDSDDFGTFLCTQSDPCTFNFSLYFSLPEYTDSLHSPSPNVQSKK